MAELEAENAALHRRADPASLSGETARIDGEIGSDGDVTDPFAAAVRTTRMPMVITDPRRADNPIVFANDAFCRLTGYPREEIVDRNCRFLQGPDTDPDTVREIRDAVRAELPVKADILNYRKDGEPFWSRLLMAPVRDGAGTLSHFFASQVDVTAERRQVEGLETDKTALLAEVTRALQGQQKIESQLRQLNDTLEQQVAARTRDLDRVWRNARDLLVVADMSGTVLAVNPATASILGRSERDMVGASVVTFLHPDDRPRLVDGVLDLDPNGTPRHATNRCLRADGSEVWISWVSVAEAGHIYGYGRDVTAEREQAEALRAAEDALRQAQKMEAVGQLTGGLAHDFNNLLTGISGSLDLLGKRLRQGRTDNLDRYIDAAQQASRRAAALTHRLLAFSRRQTLDPKLIGVDRLIDGMADLIRRTVGPAISVSVITGPETWNALVDPNQLENALLNLCINARDAMPDGGRLTVETANRVLDARGGAVRDLEPGAYVTLSVSDTGTGMSPDVVARAFDPFFTTKPLGLGTGLGLSMIYGFAKQSGGQVRIHSHAGSGTTVTLFLPRHGGHLQHDAGAEVATDQQRAEPGETVLIIDDEPTIRMLVSDVLAELGYASLEAGDGASGLAMLRSTGRIDLLVTDVGLPGGMNGRQVADAARALRPGLKVLFITGYAESAAVGGTDLEAGMGVLTKPFAMDELANRIRALLGVA
ncbi:PAS domain-containing protein [Lichenibacterium dinghuense]|uniref:PAS domain-containing protein n=1 Tax=Lichenibacterium dinghuense TaxID=2895977 RepID=UPI001F38E214|nr:PAS domain-containing protein [Lichenibacterium sp. 6Y81]